MLFWVIIGLISSTAFGQISFVSENVCLQTGVIHSPIVQSGDLNGDGQEEIISIYKEQNLKVARFDNENSGITIPLNVDCDILDFVLSDANSDGTKDIVAVGESGLMIFPIFNGQCSNSPICVYGLEYPMFEIEAYDFNKNGRDEFIISTLEDIKVISKDANNNWMEEANLDVTQASNYRLKTGDIDRDSWNDLVIFIPDGSWSYVYINQNQSFIFSNNAVHSFCGAGGNPIYNCQIANIFGDGNSLIFYSKWITPNIPNTKVIYMKNGLFEQVEMALPIPDFNAATIAADFDKNGKDELIYLSGYSTLLNVLSFKKENQVISYEILEYEIPEPSVWLDSDKVLSVGDRDGDNKEDIVFLSDVGQIWNFINTTTTEQIINVPKGWSGISSYIVPDNPGVEEIFTNTDIIVMLNANGNLYWPQIGTNTIGNWNQNTGYKVKMSEACNLSMIGTPIVLPSTINLKQGVNYLPVHSSTPVRISDLFGADTAKIILIFDMATMAIYNPEWGDFNNLVYLEPGVGYLAYMSQQCSVIYTTSFDGGIELPKRAPYNIENKTNWNTPVNTGNPHFVSCGSNATLQLGDIVGAFTNDGYCSGMAEYLGQKFVLPIFGDDPTTQEKDGFTEGEPMTYKIYRPSTRETFNININYDLTMPNHEGNFSPCGVSNIVDMTLNTTGISEFNNANVSIYPNPVVDVLNVEMEEIPDLVQVVDMTGKVIKTQKTNSEKIMVDVSSLPQGVYFVKVTFKNGQSTSAKFIK